MRLAVLIALLAGLIAAPARAQAPDPGSTAEAIRVALFNAQLSLPSDPASAAALAAEAEALYQAGLADGLAAAAPDAHQRALAGFDVLQSAAAQGQTPAFAAARADVWTALLGGAYQAAEQAMQQGNGPAAQTWLAVREFRAVTRFSRPNSDATLAADGLTQGTFTPEAALLALRADLLDTYQARLTQALRDLAEADTHGFAARRAELAALADGYFLILSPAYTEQRGPAAQAAARQALTDLRAAAVAGQPLAPALAAVEASLHNFRAAPLSAAERSRRAGQLLRYLSLVPIEYGRGVSGGRVTRDLEIQEASTFLAGAQAAFSDLESLLDPLDPGRTQQARQQFDALAAELDEAAQGTRVADPAVIESQTAALTALLTGVIPAEWRQGSTQGDFDVIGSLLDRMEAAAGNGDYALAESTRLEAYAVMESGPEARLMVFAPQLRLRLEDLFWNGPGPDVGLAALIKRQASVRDIQTTRAALDSALAEAQRTLGVTSAPAAVAANAGLIVFREGLEAVLILASLMSSLKGAHDRRNRQAMWLGTALALAATVLTWLVARGILQRLARYGERLEAVVSLIAIAILLLITNWFFHKVYWTGWVAGFHARKRQLITGEAGLRVGLAVLGFTSVYREGFETVLFLQALVLDSGAGSVLLGVGVALLAVLLVGVATFQLQVRLPHKRLLVVTGILIGGVLLQMVGATVHVMQVVGWLPIHLVGLPLPYWLGTWFGIYPTWEGIGLQALAAAFVIGSYYLAEHARHAADK